MSDDLVKRLRSQIGDDVREIYSHEALFRLAADRIAQLEEELREAREALQVYADGCEATETVPCGYEGNMCCKTARDFLAKLEARARLTGETQDGGAMSDRIEALEAERDTLVYDLARLKDSETHHLNRADAAEATITELRKEVERLRSLVFVGYHEGYTEAGGHWRGDSGWDDSETKFALDNPPPSTALQGETK